MSTRYLAWAALVAAVFSSGCSESGREPAATSPPAEPATSTEAMPPVPPERADPTVVDPGHYATEFENDRVRIVRITYGPGETSVMHYHPDNVAVYLTDADVTMSLPDGKSFDASATAGDVSFEPAGHHLPGNTSEHSLELVLVELKDGGSSPDAGGADPTEVDADHYTAEFENDRVRLVRIAYGDGEQSVMHFHPDSVAVFLTDHLVEMTLPDGDTAEISAQAGDAMFIPAGDHLPKNVMGQAWELVLVELK